MYIYKYINDLSILFLCIKPNKDQFEYTLSIELDKSQKWNYNKQIKYEPNSERSQGINWRNKTKMTFLKYLIE